jgi:hypothetical protein
VGDFRADPALVSAHVLALQQANTDLYEAALFAHCWPGGCEDRLDPISIEWVRRWTPATLRASRLDCSCVEGHCTICN